MASTSCEICGEEIDDEEDDPHGHFATEDDEEPCPVAGCGASLVEFVTVLGGTEPGSPGDLDCATCANGHDVFSRNGEPWSTDNR